jgi:8-oxo-dGTP pyrophosphatase MutT (NUDIX family)
MPELVKWWDAADGRWMSLRRGLWRDGQRAGRREWTHSKMTAAVAIARTLDGRWVLVREWRAALGGWCVQFPGGVVDEGEDPMDAAARECWEETGRRVLSVEADGLQPMATSPGLTDEEVWFFRCAVEDEPSAAGLRDDAIASTAIAVRPEDLAGFLRASRARGDRVCCWLLAALPRP